MREASSNEQSLRDTEDEHKILLRSLSTSQTLLPHLDKKPWSCMPSSRTYGSLTAHDFLVEQFGDLFTYFVDRHDFYSAAWVLHCTSILGVRYDVWRLLSTGLYPSEDHSGNWEIVDGENQDAYWASSCARTRGWVLGEDEERKSEKIGSCT